MNNRFTMIKNDLRSLDLNAFEDELMKPRVWWNQSGHTHLFECTLYRVDLKLYAAYLKNYPKVIRVPPGEKQFLPHSYFNIHTMDGRPVTGAWLKDGEVIDYGDKQKGL